MATSESISQSVYDAATKKGEEQAPYRAVRANFVASRGLILVELISGLYLGFNPRGIGRLKTASASQLKNVEVVGAGLTLHFPDLDEDLYIPRIVEEFGGPHWQKLPATA